MCANIEIWFWGLGEHNREFGYKFELVDNFSEIVFLSGNLLDFYLDDREYLLTVDRRYLVV